MNFNNELPSAKLVDLNTKLEIEIRKKEEEALLLDYSKMSLDEKEVFTQALIVSNQKLESEL